MIGQNSVSTHGLSLPEAEASSHRMSALGLGRVKTLWERDECGLRERGPAFFGMRDIRRIAQRGTVGFLGRQRRSCAHGDQPTLLLGQRAYGTTCS
jgi:hypothetical protein